ncbi:MAG: TonB-dependent receptor [Saprospiraceae bacterium]
MSMIKNDIIKVFMVVLGISCLSSFSYGQTYYQFIGTVVDENDKPLTGASVSINAINKGAKTDIHGDFVIDDLLESTYQVEISFLGYKTLRKTVALIERKKYKFQLEEASVKLDEVVIKDNYSEDRKKETSLNIEVVNDDYLKKNLGGSLMKSLERLPGVTTIDIGSGQSKPVIRGLSFNRVVVVENNIKHESQQWGADHGLEIDQYAVDNIEIIKGPASLMYGSDAIGGIIDMKNRSVPLENSYGGSVNLSGKTNNDFLGSSVSLFARKKGFFATVRATILDYGDYKVPTDSVDIYNYRVPLNDNHLRNTAGKEQNIHTSFGVIKDRFQSKFYISNVNTRNGFFANAHGLEPRNVDLEVHDASSRDILYPYQQVNHFKVINKSSYLSEKWRLELDLGYQRNYREEWSQYTQHGYMPAVFPETLDFNPEIERQFQKDIYSGNAKLFYRLSNKTQLNTGINGEYKENEIGGRGFIIPSYKQLSLGSFVVMKHNFSEKSLIQAGIRYDFGNINTANHQDWFVSPIYENGDTVSDYLQRVADINRNFSNFTWSIGYNYNPEKWSYKLNIGKSFRMPIAKELAANGVNYHRFSYEVGNADLSPEISYQLDAGVEYNSKNFAIGVSPFVNYFSNYIYLNPTSTFDRLYGFGNQVFEYTESDVFRFGGELHAHYEISNFLQLGFIGEYIHAEQLSGEKKGYTLPFLPPASAIFNIKYQNPEIAFIKDSYISLDYRLTAAQNSIVPPEKPTDGYQVFNLSLGGNVFLKNQKINIAMQVQNLFNTKYFNHMSYYRLINVPEAGRNFVINISVPFSVKMKGK